MIQLNIKPLSVNESYTGRRFKTDKYKNLEKAVLFMLPKITLPEPPYKLYFEFGVSNAIADLDNPCKSIQDILSKKYGFNDRLIYELNIKKVITEKGKEFIRFKIEHL